MRWAALLLLLLPAPLQASPAEACLVAWRDYNSVPPEDRYDLAYIWVMDEDAKLKWEAWSGAAGMVNFLSLSRRVVSPPLILADGTVRNFRQMQEGDWARLTLLRVRLHYYGQTREQWNKLGDPTLEPYFHVFTMIPYPAGRYASGKEYPAGAQKEAALAPWLMEPLGVKDPKPYQDAVIGLSKALGPCPIVEARNFVWQTSVDFGRKAGYYSWLRVTDQKSWEKLVRLDRSGPVLREAVSASGVAKEPRAIDRFGRGDGVWYTYDQVAQSALNERNPLEELDRRKFFFDAIEAFGRLDNGLWAMGLFDAKGAIQQSAPDGVGYNHQAVLNDGKIHVFLACLVCHDSGPGNGGLKPFDPYFRQLAAEPGPQGLAAFKDLKRFEEEYLSPLEFWADNDKRIYAAALGEANGLLPNQFAANLHAIYLSFDRPLTLAAAAREYGVPPQQLVLALQASLVNDSGIDLTNANWVKPPQRMTAIPRMQFTASYNRGHLSLRGLPTWPEELRKKLQPWKR